jgi:hypothetical protein
LGHGRQSRQTAAFPQSLIVREEVRSARAEPPAHRTAVLIANELRVLTGEEVPGVEHSISQIVVYGAVPFVAAGSCHHVHLGRGAPSVLGAVAVVQQLEFADRFHRWLQHIAVVVGIVVVRAVEGEVVVLFAPAGSVHREAAARTQFGVLYWRQHAGHQQAKLEEVAPVEGEIADTVALQDVALRPTFRCHRLERREHGDGLAHFADLHAKVLARVAVYIQPYAFGGLGTEPIGHNADTVGAGRQRRYAVVTVEARDNAPFVPTVLAENEDAGIRHGAAARVRHDAGDRTRDRLSGQGTGANGCAHHDRLKQSHDSQYCTISAEEPAASPARSGTSLRPLPRSGIR